MKTHSKFDPRRPLAFVHIPKTSGISITGGVECLFPEQARFKFIDRVQFGGFSEFNTVGPQIRAMMIDCGGVLPSHAGFVAGHFSVSSISKACPDAQIITFLREARSRLISHWLYWRHHDDAALAWLGSFAPRIKRARGSLMSFLLDPETACATDNIMTRFLLWPHILIPEDGFIPDRHTEQLASEALAVLSELAYFNVIEDPNFEGSFSRWLGCAFAHSSQNVVNRELLLLDQPFIDHLNPDVLSLLDNRTRIDQEIWHAAAATKRLPAQKLGQFIFSRTIARYSALQKSVPGHENKVDTCFY